MIITLTVIAIWILSTCLHEFGHAITAYIAGDKSVKEKGYLTLNPMVYFNSVTTLIIPLFVLMVGGIPLPGAAVYINHNKIKSRIWLSLVSLAGPLFTFFFLVLLAIFINVMPLFPTVFGDQQTFKLIYCSIAFLIYLHIFVFMLNMLPLPPLDGYGIIEPWLPKNVQNKMRELANYGFALLFVLFFMVDDFARFFSTVSITGTYLLGVEPKAVAYAAQAFEESSKFLVVFLIIAWIVKGRFQSAATKGDAELKKQNYEVALEHYLAAKEKSPDDTRLDLAIATCLLSMDRASESHPYLDNVLKIEPDDVRAISLKAACLSEEGRYQEATKLLESIPEENEEGIAFPYIVKTSALMESGSFDEALVAIDESLKVEPKNAHALQLKAACLEALEQYDQAIDVYTFMARTKEGFQTACIFKGMLLLSMGKEEEGWKNVKKILSPKQEDRPEDFKRLKKLFFEKAVELNQAGRKEFATNLQNAGKKLMESDPFETG